MKILSQLLGIEAASWRVCQIFRNNKKECLRTDFNIHGTKYIYDAVFNQKSKKLWCRKPPVPFVGQKLVLYMKY